MFSNRKNNKKGRIQLNYSKEDKPNKVLIFVGVFLLYSLGVCLNWFASGHKNLYIFNAKRKPEGEKWKQNGGAKWSLEIHNTKIYIQTCTLIRSDETTNINFDFTMFAFGVSILCPCRSSFGGWCSAFDQLSNQKVFNVFAFIIYQQVAKQVIYTLSMVFHVNSRLFDAWNSELSSIALDLTVVDHKINVKILNLWINKWKWRILTCKSVKWLQTWLRNEFIESHYGGKFYLKLKKAMKHRI